MVLQNTKKKKDTQQSNIEYKLKCLDVSMSKMEEDITEMKKTVSRIRSVMDAHINRQYAEIRVVEENGEWGDYSGVFYVDDDNAKEVVVNKAKKHFASYFEDGIWHGNKKLGLFVFSPKSGLRLVERMETQGGI